MENVFGEMLATVRQRKEITLREIAEHLNCSIGYVCDVENGRRRPFDDKRINRLADLLDMSHDELYQAAGESRGVFTLDTHFMKSRKAVDVAGKASRVWCGLSDEQLGRIEAILDEEM